MTLIIGTANDDIAFLVGETSLTPILEIKGNPPGPVNREFHGLKIQIIDENHALAFATSNAANVALQVIAAVAEAMASDSSIDIFQKTHDCYLALCPADGEKPDCEFLVLKLEDDRRRLAHITASGVKFVMRAYIGDQEQWTKLNELRQPYASPTVVHVQQPDGSFKTEPLRDSAGQVEFLEVSEALTRLVQQRRRDGIGAIAGNIIRVRNAWPSGKLEYLQTHMAGTSPEEGAMGYSLLASNAGKRGVGIYYIAGKLGFVMIVGDAEFCRLIRAETMNEFKRIAQDSFGLDLS